MRGITFEIPNKYGKQLLDILQVVDVEKWDWQIGGGEAYIIENGILGEDLFGRTTDLTGEQFLKRISETDYYLIFADLKAYPKISTHVRIETYADFLESDCQFVILVVDSSYVTIYSKDQSIIYCLNDRAIALNYEHIEYITDENDGRTTLIAF